MSKVEAVKDEFNKFLERVKEFRASLSSEEPMEVVQPGGSIVTTLEGSYPERMIKNEGKYPIYIYGWSELGLARKAILEPLEGILSEFDYAMK